MPLFTRKKAEATEERPPLMQLPPLPEPPPPGPTGLRSLAAHRAYLLGCVDELPRFDNSAMDGYAVRAADVAGASPDRPVSLPVVGEIAAGSAAVHRLSPG